MNRFFLAVAVVSALSLSSLLASNAVAGNVHKTVVVHANGNVTKKITSGRVHHHHHHHGHNNGVILKSNGVILKTQNFGIRIGR